MLLWLRSLVHQPSGSALRSRRLGWASWRLGGAALGGATGCATGSRSAILISRDGAAAVTWLLLLRGGRLLLLRGARSCGGLGSSGLAGGGALGGLACGAAGRADGLCRLARRRSWPCCTASAWSHRLGQMLRQFEQSNAGYSPRFTSDVHLFRSNPRAQLRYLAQTPAAWLAPMHRLPSGCGPGTRPRLKLPRQRAWRQKRWHRRRRRHCCRCCRRRRPAARPGRWRRASCLAAAPDPSECRSSLDPPGCRCSSPA